MRLHDVDTDTNTWQKYEIWDRASYTYFRAKLLHRIEISLNLTGSA